MDIIKYLVMHTPIGLYLYVMGIVILFHLPLIVIEFRRRRKK